MKLYKIRFVINVKTGSSFTLNDPGVVVEKLCSTREIAEEKLGELINAANLLGLNSYINTSIIEMEIE